VQRLLYAFIIVCALLTLTVLCLAAAKAPAGVHPIVDINADLLFGGAIDGKWVDENKMMPRIKGGETYRLYSFTRFLGTGVGKKAEMNELSGNSPIVEVKPAGNLRIDDTCTIGICGEWNALPRVPKEGDRRQKCYETAVHDMLVKKGLPNARVHVTRVVQVDLDGDGKDETLISATTPRRNYPDPQPRKNDYSLILLQRTVKGKMESILIDGDFRLRDEAFAAPYRYTIDAVLDVNGDGEMDVVVGWSYYEGRGRSIFHINGKKVEQVLEAGVGA